MMSRMKSERGGMARAELYRAAGHAPTVHRAGRAGATCGSSRHALTTALVAGLGLGLALATGCGPIDQPPAAPAKAAPPPPPPPPPPPHIAALADVAGDWTGTDQDGWTYTLHVDADGGFHQQVDRGGRGPCEQAGKLALDPQVGGPAQPEGQAVGLTYQQNTCVVSNYPGMQAIAEVRAFTPTALELHFTDGSIHYARGGGPAAAPAPAAPTFATPPAN